MVLRSQSVGEQDVADQQGAFSHYSQGFPNGTLFCCPLSIPLLPAGAKIAASWRPQPSPCCNDGPLFSLSGDSATRISACEKRGPSLTERKSCAETVEAPILAPAGRAGAYS